MVGQLLIKNSLRKETKNVRKNTDNQDGQLPNCEIRRLRNWGFTVVILRCFSMLKQSDTL